MILYLGVVWYRLSKWWNKTQWLDECTSSAASCCDAAAGLLSAAAARIRLERPAAGCIISFVHPTALFFKRHQAIFWPFIRVKSELVVLIVGTSIENLMSSLETLDFHQRIFDYFCAEEPTTHRKSQRSNSNLRWNSMCIKHVHTDESQKSTAFYGT